MLDNLIKKLSRVFDTVFLTLAGLLTL